MSLPEEAIELIIRECAAGIFGCETVSRFQMEGIRSLIFPQKQHSSPHKNQHCPCTCVFVGGGSGRSLIMNCAATIARGITVHVVPNVSLGDVQIENFNQNVSQGIGIKAFHLETLGNTNEIQLVTDLRALLEMTDSRTDRRLFARTSPIVLVATQQTLLDQKLPWFKLLIELSEKPLIRLLTIDDAHKVVEDGITSRSEFVHLKTLMHQLNKFVPVLVTSATSDNDYLRRF